MPWKLLGQRFEQPHAEQEPYVEVLCIKTPYGNNDSIPDEDEFNLTLDDVLLTRAVPKVLPTAD